MFSVLDDPATEDWPRDDLSGIDKPSGGVPGSNGHPRVPAWLDGMEPGPTLAVILSSIEVDRCSGHDRVIVLRSHQRMASHYQAHVYGDIASVSDHLEEVDHRHPDADEFESGNGDFHAIALQAGIPPWQTPFSLIG